MEKKNENPLAQNPENISNKSCHLQTKRGIISEVCRVWPRVAMGQNDLI